MQSRDCIRFLRYSGWSSTGCCGFRNGLLQPKGCSGLCRDSWQLQRRSLRALFFEKNRGLCPGLLQLTFFVSRRPFKGAGKNVSHSTAA